MPVRTFRATARRWVIQTRRPESLAFLPALTLAAFWLGGENMLLAVALGLPALFALAGGFAAVEPKPPASATDGTTGLGLRDAVVAQLNTILAAAGATGRTTCCFVLSLDEADQLADRLGSKALSHILRCVAERLQAASRDVDVIARLEGATFAVALAGIRRADLEAMLQMAARLQSACDAPISLDATTIYLSSSVGFCLASRTPESSGHVMLEAAEAAALEARRNGPGAIRSYTQEMKNAHSVRHALRSEIETALDSGQIVAHFQPQISTDTGALTGFEALARWNHPERGLLPPGEFLEPLRAAGLSERLSEVMLVHAITALCSWDKAGLSVPNVAVNFSSEELRNPKIAEKLKWELDRFDLAASRLTIEILETVVAETANDVIVRNISALAALGCGIDLDDFGTGHASIANIRRFAVSRIKIDRSFVTHVDEDRDQQKMISAILSMAERLGLETLAEGVETIGEHAILAQLGCDHVQGFSIGRPMNFNDTLEWFERHRERLANTPRLSQRLGRT